MSRFEYAVSITDGPLDPPLIELAKKFAEAVEQTELEGLTPYTDPAVLLLGSFIAFQVHADVNSATGYQRLIQQCFDRINAPRVLQ